MTAVGPAPRRPRRSRSPAPAPKPTDVRIDLDHFEDRAFVLPVGSYMLAVVKDGRRTEQRLQIRDGALVTFNLQLIP